MKSIVSLLICCLPFLSLTAQDHDCPVYLLQFSKNQNGKTLLLKPGDKISIKSSVLKKKELGYIQAVLPTGILVEDMWVPLESIEYLRRISPDWKGVSLGAFAALGGSLYLQRLDNNINQGGTNSVFELMTATAMLAGGLAAVVDNGIRVARNKLVYKKGKAGSLEVIPWNFAPASPDLNAKGE